MNIMFCQFFVLYQILLSLQMKRSVIISNKLVYTICLTSCCKTYLGSQESRKYQENLKTSLNYGLVSSLTTKTKHLSILGKTVDKQKLNFSRTVLFRVKTRVCVKYFFYDCLYKQLFDSNLPRHPHVISLTFLTQFFAKTRGIKLRESIKIGLP